MTGYTQINIKNMLTELGEDRVRAVLSEFYCPLNKDVEDFLRTKAIEFSKQDITRTYLVVASYKGAAVPAGYYAICNKYFLVDNKVLSSNLKRRIRKFATYIKELNRYQVVAPLTRSWARITQMGIINLSQVTSC